jgi:predicted RNA-binding protein YlqC (UPF0109 family)
MNPVPKSPSPTDASVQQLVLSIVEMLVDDASAVRIDCMEEDGATTLHIRVGSADMGKLIGKQGRTARSLRTILSAAGMKLHRRYALNIEEEARDERTD